MHISKHYLLIIFTCLTQSACSITQQYTKNHDVRLIQKNELNIVHTDKQADCHYLGEIIGSEGHWYSYLFVSNRALVQGAINDLYNQANNIGANVVFISDDVSFNTSVTFYGQAYNCIIQPDEQ